MAISHVSVVSFIDGPGKTSLPYSTAAPTGKLCDTCGVRNDYIKKLSVFRVQWKPFSKRGWKLNFSLISNPIFWDVLLTVWTTFCDAASCALTAIYLWPSIHYCGKYNYLSEKINLLVLKYHYGCVFCEVEIFIFTYFKLYMPLDVQTQVFYW